MFTQIKSIVFAQMCTEFTILTATPLGYVCRALVRVSNFSRSGFEKKKNRRIERASSWRLFSL